MVSMSLRAAVIGTRGIGKHHAKWFAAEGADLVAVCSSREETAWLRREELHDLFGYDGPAYSDVAAMLRETRPAAVSIASPVGLHAAHIDLCLDAGAHVLCEKPLVHDSDAGLDGSLRLAERLVEKAAVRGLTLAVMTQYAALAPALRKLGEFTMGRGSGIWHFGMRMESAPATGAQTYGNVFLDLGPHCLALLLALAPGARIREGSLEVSLGKYRTRAAFDCEVPSTDGRGADPCTVCLSTGKSDHPVREIEINGMRVAYEGRAGEDGMFAAYLTVGDHEACVEDPMRLTVRHFVERVLTGAPGPIAAGDEALASLSMLHTVLRAGMRRREEVP